MTAAQALPAGTGRARALRFAAAAASAAFILALPVLLFTSVIRILSTDTGFAERGLREHGAAAATGLTLLELDRAAAAVVRYFEDDAETLRVIVLDRGQERALFTEVETQHMRDVKALMRALFRANEASLAFVLAYAGAAVLWSGERSSRQLAKQTLAAVGAGATAALAVGLLALALGFDRFWSLFHEIAFTNDFWRLDPARDRLIQMYPEAFWQEASLIAGGMTLGAAAALAALAGAWLWFTRPSRERGDGDAPARERPTPIMDAGAAIGAIGDQEEQPQPPPPQAQPPPATGPGSN